jgi:hypothetical protein
MNWEKYLELVTDLQIQQNILVRTGGEQILVEALTVFIAVAENIAWQTNYYGEFRQQ